MEEKLHVTTFEKLWEASDTPPDWADFLKQHPGLNQSQIVSIVLIDQRERSRVEQPLTVDEYVSQFPCLDSPEIRLRLAVGELAHGKSDETQHESGPANDNSKDGREDDLVDPTVSYSGGVPPLNGSQNANHIPPQIDRYQIRHELGRGGFGVVYLAFDLDLEREVAVKVPWAKSFKNRDAAEAYAEEARTLATLDHPNVVPVYDTGRTEDGIVYIVSKYIDGKSLFDFARVARLPFAKTAALVSKVANGLDHAHSRGIIHQDVKPGNILIERSTDIPYLTDFGLAIREDDAVGARDTIMGTPI